jgi:3'-phosphoadenosine 5'-phosphosulfate sulfotransferase (PAPS reductase)/FAD synthetase
MVAGLIFDMLRELPKEQRKKAVEILCTDTCVEIPAIVGMIDATLDKMRRFAEREALHVQVHSLKPPPAATFWVNIIGRGYGGMEPNEARRMKDLEEENQRLKRLVADQALHIVAQSDQAGALTWTASYEAGGKRTTEMGTNDHKQRANCKDEDPMGLFFQ